MQLVDGQSECWARESEIDNLIKRISENPRSATFLYGDSGIGKSAVLSELRSRLLNYPRMSIGVHESSAVDHDPLLSVLNALLFQVFQRSAAVEEIAAACGQRGDE